MNPAGFLDDILAEPERLADLAADVGRGDDPLAPLVPLLAAAPRRLLLLGMGSSLSAARGAAHLLRAGGFEAVAEVASARRLPPPAPDRLVVAISATLGSEETRAALARYRHACPTVLVTNRPDRATGLADAVVDLRSGPEPGGVACRTFQATLAALGLLGHRLAGLRECGPDAVSRAAESAAGTLASRGDWLDEAVALLAAGGPIHAIAPAARISTAEQSALMLREGPRLPAGAAETGDWLHVDVYLTVWPGYRALLFTGAPHDANVLDWVRRRGGALIAVGRPLAGATLHVPFADAQDDVVASLVETSVIELAAAELWRRQVA